MKRKIVLTVLFSLVLPLISCGVYAQIERVLEKESDGFSWYETRQNDYYGAETTSGKTLIPLSRRYNFIMYDNMGYRLFYVKRNGKEGVCNVNGNEIIAPSRYDKVCFHDEEEHIGWFGVKRNGKEGACDITGKEIIPPIYSKVICSPSTGGFQYKNDTGEWIKLGYTLDANGHGIQTTSSNTSSSSNSNRPSSDHNNSGLLYKGEYTVSGMGTTEHQTISISEDQLCASIECFNYKSTNSRGERIYKGTETFGAECTYYVSSNYNIRLVKSYFNPYNSTYNNVTFTVTKGASKMPANQGVNSSVGGNSEYQWQEIEHKENPVQPHQVTTSCSHCHGSGKCSTCNGKHWYYGIGGSKITCPNCTPNGACSSCGGSGKTTSTKYY